ncbi:MAG: hypothetical protein EPN85_02050 [Bacteroidetes bacterium]|nr:MAG: hypothetical protein EPN85_02050 [Bacteroidota bacterium]
MSASNRSLLFLLGLVLGLLAGAGFFIFKMDDIFKNINILNSSRDTLIIQQQDSNNPNEKKSKTQIKKNRDTSQRTMSSAELLAKKYSREVPVRKVMAEADSLLRDTSFGAQQINVDDFVVRKDEMLGSRNFEVTNLQQTEVVNPSDSLLEKISGIKDGKKNVIASFKVEFWQSPINYKGYKMTKNKIVLFGISAEENLKFFHSDDALFMKQNQNYFKLYFTDEFKQFEKIKAPLNLPEGEK